MSFKTLDSDLLDFMIEHEQRKPGEQLPPLNDLADALEINVGKLREQLEVARSMGLVEVRPRTGIRVKPYEFLPAIRLSLLFAVAVDKHHFEQYTEVRNHVEVAFWNEAVALLTEADKAALCTLVDTACAKLNNAPFIQIPHAEHRQFHMGLFARLDNPFVKGILEAYWEAYEAVEFNTYSELNYWQEAWSYHKKIINFITEGDVEAAKQAFVDHTRLLRHRFAHPPVAVGVVSPPQVPVSNKEK